MCTQHMPNISSKIVHNYDLIIGENLIQNTKNFVPIGQLIGLVVQARPTQNNVVGLVATGFGPLHPPNLWVVHTCRDFTRQNKEMLEIPWY